MDAPGRLRMFAQFAAALRPSLTPQLMSQLHQQYCIREFKIEEVTVDAAIALFTSVVNKNQKTNYARSELCWHENELRVFVWTLVMYGHVQKIDLEDMDSSRWEFFLGLFPSKPQILFDYQCLNLLKKHNQYKKWVHQEDQLFQQLVRQDELTLRWSDLAKHLYIQSGRRYFRTPKQCRERWLNHLDPSKLKKYWLLEEDLTLVEFVREYGKKWATISKKLGSRRNEHSIKNRFKSLMTKQAKSYSTNTSQSQLVDYLYQRLLRQKERQEEKKKQQQPQALQKEMQLSQKEGESVTANKKQSQLCENMLAERSINEHRQAEKTTAIPEFHLTKMPSHISVVLPHDQSLQKHSEGESEMEYRIRADLMLQEDPFDALRQYFNGPPR